MASETAEKKVVRFNIGGQTFAIPDAAADQKGLMSAADFTKIKELAALAFKQKVEARDLADEVRDYFTIVLDNKERVRTLQGTGNGSVAKMIDDAFNEFSTNVTNDDVVNSYKELIDWAAQHGGEAAQLAAAITNLEGQYRKLAADTTDSLADKVDKVSGKNLSTNDFTNAYKTKLEGIAGGATKNTWAYDESTLTLSLTGFAVG